MPNSLIYGVLCIYGAVLFMGLYSSFSPMHYNLFSFYTKLPIIPHVSAPIVIIRRFRNWKKRISPHFNRKRMKKNNWNWVLTTLFSGYLILSSKRINYYNNLQFFAKCFPYDIGDTHRKNIIPFADVGSNPNIFYIKDPKYLLIHETNE